MQYSYGSVIVLILIIVIACHSHAAGTTPESAAPAGVTPQNTVPDIKKLLDEGNRLYGEGNYRQAIVKYTVVERILEKTTDPNLLSAIYNRGLSYHKAGDYIMAIEDFSRVITLSPADAPAHLNRGNAYALNKQRANAIDDYTKAIALDPANAALYYARGITYQEVPDTIDRGIEDFIKAITLNPADKKSMCFLGIAYYKKRDYRTSARYFDEAISVDPRFKEAYTGRGQANLKRDRATEALADFIRACEMGDKLGCTMHELLLKKDRGGIP
jgi:tetratricopeptide (TPR) repeat protein